MSMRKLLSLIVPLLATAIALSTHHARAARPARAKPPAPSPFIDFGALSGARPRACAPSAEPLPSVPAAAGQAVQRSCAWSGRLELSYWPALAAAPGCLPPAAVAWHRLNAAGADVPPWNAAWTARARVVDGLETAQALAVWRGTDGNWSAARWRWRPADRAATRAWEAGHWQDVVRAAQAMSGPVPAPSPLLRAWLDASSGKPRAVDGDAWRWIGDGTCLTLRAADVKPGQSQLHWSRDDARLEQRTGMQVQLARRFPQAEWLQPFTLLEPTVADKRTGAKFTAIWKEGDAVQGQLWMPLRDGSGVVRARVSAPASAGRGPVEAALTAVAHAWEVRHE